VTALSIEPKHLQDGGAVMTPSAGTQTQNPHILHLKKMQRIEAVASSVTLEVYTAMKTNTKNINQYSFNWQLTNCNCRQTNAQSKLNEVVTEKSKI
jgi:hypothetical protein